MAEEQKCFILLYCHSTWAHRNYNKRNTANRWLWLWDWRRISASRIRATRTEWLVLWDNMEAEKERSGAKRKGTPSSRPAGCQPAPLLTFHKAWPVLLWPEDSHRGGQPPCHSPGWTPYYARLYPNTYCLHFFYLLRDRQRCFPEKCLSGQNKPLHSLKAELAVKGVSAQFATDALRGVFSFCFFICWKGCIFVDFVQKNSLTANLIWQKYLG